MTDKASDETMHLCKQKFISHPDEPIKEFTMATCGCLYHQKCLEGYILNIAKIRAKLMCPNWDCKDREIETLIAQDLFKEMAKPTSSTADVTKPQSLSKITDVTKESSDQATSPIEVVSTTPGNSDNLDELILKDTSGQI
ncbi:12650_t:CDS:2 [Funneliformis caledonium]|uniref:12650_t:CDS:1 n=1 Tax=Funneliformis caledonium TaxID=1117310 RepID=A0A9N9HDJ3_9GLOM|nr:12650_t:CDS:2 [Funneliformis caledonium]